MQCSGRFERKKDIGKAVRAFALMLKQTSAGARQKTVLVVAGGYDPRVMENLEYKKELEQLAQSLGIGEQTIFVPSFSSEERSVLLSRCIAGRRLCVSLCILVDLGGCGALSRSISPDDIAISSFCEG